MALYRKATPERYNSIHMDLQENPPRMYKNFDELIATGDSAMENKVDEEILKKENVEENVEDK
jgi:hypothetical protein